ncbi:MAG: PD40 domain-containing protein [Vicinamibacteria bacterium]|nr:PD40 domain-containing protein [Vicinamibacteria bacterium]
MFKATAANESDPAFSPGGRWIAYTASESGTDELFVSPFPGPGPAVPVSQGGGSHAVWAVAAHEQGIVHRDPEEVDRRSIAPP